MLRLFPRFLVALVLGMAFSVVTTPPSDAARNICSATGLAEWAKDSCREQGWVIRPRLAVNPNNWIARVGMPKCTGSKDTLCVHNVNRDAPRLSLCLGGPSYWVSKNGRHHEVNNWDLCKVN